MLEQQIVEATSHNVFKKWFAIKTKMGFLVDWSAKP